MNHDIDAIIIDPLIIFSLNSKKIDHIDISNEIIDMHPQAKAIFSIIYTTPFNHLIY